MSTMRLQVWLAHAGVASRRHAEEWIRAGRVTVNGQVVTQMGTLVDPLRDRVHVDHKLVEAEPFVYVLCNKPKGVVCTNQDPQGRPTLLSLLRFGAEDTQAEPPRAKVPKAPKPRDADNKQDVPRRKPWISEPVPSGQGPLLPNVRLFPVGRLDYNSEGAILLTNDGGLAHRLMHPSHGVTKVYHAKLEGHLTHAQIQQLRRGVELPARPGAVARRTEYSSPAEVLLLMRTDKNTWLEIILEEGKNRQIRRMAEAIGSEVRKLARLAYADLSVTEMPIGSYRLLQPYEIQTLYDRVGLSFEDLPVYTKGGSAKPQKTGSGRKRTPNVS